MPSMLRILIIASCAFVVSSRTTKRQEYDSDLDFFGAASDNFEHWDHSSQEAAPALEDTYAGGGGDNGGAKKPAAGKGGGAGKGGSAGGGGKAAGGGKGGDAGKGNAGGGGGGGTGNAGGSKKVGFSAGSGLRSIAQGSADQANSAVQNQHIAAQQAAYVAKNTLAQAAAAASATAQAALAGKQVILQGFEQQVRDAKLGADGEQQQMMQAQRAAAAAAQASQQAQHHVNVLTAALNAAQATAEHAGTAAAEAAGELAAQTAMVGAAKQRLQALTEQLQGIRIDFQATQAAAMKAMQSAQQAQANAAKAAADAAISLEAPLPTQAPAGGADHGQSGALTAEYYDNYNDGYAY